MNNSTANLIVRLMQATVVLLLVLFSLPWVLQEHYSVGWWLMLVLPLLLLLPRLHTNARRPLQWLGFLVLFYFAVGVLQLFSADPLQRWLGALTVLGCLLLFTAAIVRLRIVNRQME